MPAHTNGFMPDSAEAQLSALLDATVDELQTRHDLLKVELAEVSTKLARYKKMQAAGEAPTSKPARGSTPDGPKAKVSAALAERVFVALKDAGEPRSVRALSEQLSIARGSVDAAIKKLREDDRVRFAGKDTSVTIGVAPALWATFPELPEPEPAPAGPASFRPAKAATRERVLDAVRAHGEPATLTDIIARSGVSEVAVRNAVRALQEDGALRDAGTAAVRADGATHGKMPHIYVLA
jgi:hypothetical protein